MYPSCGVPAPLISGKLASNPRVRSRLRLRESRRAASRFKTVGGGRPRTPPTFGHGVARRRARRTQGNARMDAWLDAVEGGPEKSGRTAPIRSGKCPDLLTRLEFRQRTSRGEKRRALRAHGQARNPVPRSSVCFNLDGLNLNWKKRKAPY